MRTEIIGDATLYLGDCADVLHRVSRACKVVSDPPYGIDYQISARSNRGSGLTAANPLPMPKRGAIYGDDRPFDPAPLLDFAAVAIFGANHMNGLPAGKNKWIVWDKRRDSRPDDHSDCELIWTNVPGALRIHRQKWRGIVREGEENCANSLKLHPNQKPVALLEFVFDQIGVVEGDTVFDPYMGSGSTGLAALRRGLKFIGCEIDQEHFYTACNRLSGEKQTRMAL